MISITCGSISPRIPLTYLFELTFLLYCIVNTNGMLQLTVHLHSTVAWTRIRSLDSPALCFTPELKGIPYIC